jgi:quaternary ammonium compound-resistance protein SugE
VLTAIAIVVSMSFLALAVRTIPIGTGYAIWTGIGVVGTAAISILHLAEPVTAWRLLFLLMVVGGIIGLKITAS